METQIKHDIKKDGDNIIYSRTITQVIEGSDKISQLKALEAEILKVRKDEKDLKLSIDEKQAEVRHTKIVEELDKLDDLQKSWDEIIKPEMEQLKKEVTQLIKVKKAEKGYSRTKDSVQKIRMATRILADVATEKDLDMQHPILMELRPKFDSI